MLLHTSLQFRSKIRTKANTRSDPPIAIALSVGSESTRRLSVAALGIISSAPCGVFGVWGVNNLIG